MGQVDKYSGFYNALILGAGPAGMGPLVCAAQRGQLAALLGNGLAMVERGTQIGGGALGQYLVYSDSYAGVFLECLDNDNGAHLFREILPNKLVQQLRQLRNGHAPLPLIGSYLDLLGSVLQRQLDESPRSCFLPHAEGLSVHLHQDGMVSVRTALCTPSGRPVFRALCARSVVLALGGQQLLHEVLGVELAPDLRLADRHAGKVMLTRELLTRPGLRRALTRLRQAGTAKVVIIGGSHSALSAAWALLYALPALDRFPFRAGDIHILHRRPIRVFYPSAADAREDGYTTFSPLDICPLTRRVHRLGGLRGDARQLYRRVARLGNAPPERRVRLLSSAALCSRPAEFEQLLSEAALIVPAFGYRPRTIPIYGPNGDSITLATSQGGPLVDSRCRVLRQNGSPLYGLFGIGLASGFRPSGPMGGEASFQGKTSGVWLYHNDIGALILDQIM